MANNGRSSKHWGPAPRKDGPAARWFGPGKAVGTDTLGAAVGELHQQHPWDQQGEDVRHSRIDGRHHPVTSGTYSSTVRTGGHSNHD
jgi:hypothetical protein